MCSIARASVERAQRRPAEVLHVRLGRELGVVQRKLTVAAMVAYFCRADSVPARRAAGERGHPPVAGDDGEAPVGARLHRDGLNQALRPEDSTSSVSSRPSIVVRAARGCRRAGHRNALQRVVLVLAGVSRRPCFGRAAGRLRVWHLSSMVWG